MKTGNCEMKKTVGLGRTEISVRLYFVGALSFGHGPRGRGFGGVSKNLAFHDVSLGHKRSKKLRCLRNGPRPSQKMQLDWGTLGNGFSG